MDFRGQGESGMKKDGGNVAGTLERHAEDVREYAKYIRGRKKYEKVFVVGHSFGGLIAQKVFAEDDDDSDDDDSDDDERIKEAKLFDGMILLASVPPTGNSEMVKRFLKKDLWKSMKITYAFISKQFGADPKSCRECFFSEEVEEKDIEKYMRLINDSSKARLLDLKKLNEELPIVDKSKGRQKGKEKVLVIGGKDDYVVDEEGVRETAEFWHVEANLIEGLAHDVMLDAKWQTVAERMMQFVNSSS
jgi:alpha-beta hydrolase superfamily lysophospholipase